MHRRHALPLAASLLLASSPTLFADRDRVTTQDPAPAAKAKPANEKEAKVRALLDATRASKMGDLVMQQMIEVFRTMPNLPEGFLDKFQEVARPDELVELIVPIYERNLDAKDLDAVLTFMKSDVGKRWIAAQETITKESMVVGQKWGQELAARVLKELGK